MPHSFLCTIIWGFLMGGGKLASRSPDGNGMVRDIIFKRAVGFQDRKFFGREREGWATTALIGREAKAKTLQLHADFL